MPFSQNYKIQCRLNLPSDGGGDKGGGHQRSHAKCLDSSSYRFTYALIRLRHNHQFRDIFNCTEHVSKFSNPVQACITTRLNHTQTAKHESAAFFPMSSNRPFPSLDFRILTSAMLFERRQHSWILRNSSSRIDFLILLVGVDRGFVYASCFVSKRNQLNHSGLSFCINGLLGAPGSLCVSL